MCGFAGVLGIGACDKNSLDKMISTLHHRGPDDKGLWCDENVGIGLAFARLSIQDLSPAGHQPMISDSGKYVIVFNGEIYNHLTIRKELEKLKQAPRWRGHSDTETLLAGFEAWGIEDTIKRTVGMFAIAIWNTQSHILTLGRDRMGEKPLYYGFQGKTFLFGSELKALKAHSDFNSDIDRNAVAEYVQFCYIPAPKSIHNGIFKLLPGTLLSLQDGDVEVTLPIPYWSLLDVALKGFHAPFSGTDTEAVECLEKLLIEAVNSQQISDVPLGAFLSGGIDSSLIVALMQSQSNQPINTFTIGFTEEQYNEANFAKAVARHLGTSHTEYYVSPEEARSIIPRLSVLYDEPFSDSSQIPVFLISQLARQKVTVSLSGDAGDELFGGYNRYTWTRKMHRIPFLIRKIISVGLTSIGPNQWDKMYDLLKPVLPKSFQISMPGDKAHKLAAVLGIGSIEAMYKQLISTWSNPEELVLGGKNNLDKTNLWTILNNVESSELKMMFIDALTYLPDDILCKNDRASMGVSLETRVPFLDHRVLDFAWQLPLKTKIRNGQSKWILRQLLYKYVPKELIDRPKMGFGVPIDSWLRGPLREWAEDLLDESRLHNEGYFNPDLIRLKWAEHLSGKRNWQYHLWNVLMFQEWLAEQKK